MAKIMMRRMVLIMMTMIFLNLNDNSDGVRNHDEDNLLMDK